MIIKTTTGSKLLDIAWPTADGTYDLSNTYLSWANLSRADLSSANLSRADLIGADLGRADLSSADLSWADLSSANLSWADLRCADLRWADLRGSDLIGANLRGSTVIDAGQDSRSYRFVARQGDPMMIAAGCRWLTGTEARAHWANNPECLGKVEQIIAEATRRDWII